MTIPDDDGDKAFQRSIKARTAPGHNLHKDDPVAPWFDGNGFTASRPFLSDMGYDGVDARNYRRAIWRARLRWFFFPFAAIAVTVTAVLILTAVALMIWDHHTFRTGSLNELWRAAGTRSINF